MSWFAGSPLSSFRLSRSGDGKRSGAPRARLVALLCVSTRFPVTSNKLQPINESETSNSFLRAHSIASARRTDIGVETVLRSGLDRSDEKVIYFNYSSPKATGPASKSASAAAASLD